MKELSIEQKAKRYDEILARAKGANIPYYKDDIMSKVKEFVDYLLPEIKESEDDRIKKSIISFLITISSLKDGKTVSNEDFDSKAILEWVAWLEKQGEQKPAWSEEDEVMLETAISSINLESVMEGLKSRGISYSIDSSTHLMENLIDWLKPLKDRVQPQQEWSEDGEDILKQCLYFFNGGKGGISDNRREEILNWLKSLKYRYTWKPINELTEKK